MESCASTNGSIRATKACLVKVVAVLAPPSRTALQEHSSTPCAKPTASKHPSNRWHRSRTIAVWPNPLPRAQSGCLTHSSPEGAAGDSPAPLPKGREPEVRVPFGPGVQRRKARQNAGSPLANPSILSLPCIGVQNLSPTPLLPCLQWVAPFLQSRFRRGSRIPGCPNPCTRQVATAPVSAPGILVRQTRGDGRRGLPSPFPDGSGHPWRRRCPERSSRS